MDTKTDALVSRALEGDRDALEALLAEVQDTVFNLSLRMLGTPADAEDASQDILVRVMTNLASFRRESSFSTWVYRIAVNSLIDYKKSMFAHAPLSFDFYGADIASVQDAPYTGSADAELLAEELKFSCTNVMLQCLSPEDRCIFILGTMFRVDSRIAGEALGISAANYRQKLSRIRKRMSAFLAQYCGLSGTGMCSCKRRAGHAVKQGRIDPEKPAYTALETLDSGLLASCKDEMEAMDDSAAIFASFPAYRSPMSARQFLRELLDSRGMDAIRAF